MVINAKDNTCLIEKNATSKVYPASTTKILTCILALENLNLEDNVTVTDKMLAELPRGSSTMKLKAGDTLTVNELLHGLMVPSGNDAAIVVAHLVSGSTSEFAKLMNEKMKQLGATNTNFVNPHGFHDVNHYTTAEDMAKLMQYAIKNQNFLEIISTQKFTIKNKTLDITYKNTNALLGTLNYDIIGKTGYTDEAGNVFISYSKHDDIELIIVLLDGDKNYYNNEYRFDDTVYLNKYIYENYKYNNIILQNALKLQCIDKQNGNTTTYTNLNEFNTLVKSSDKNSVEYAIDNLFSDEPMAKINITGSSYYINDYDMKLSSINSYKISKKDNLDMKLVLIILFDLIFILILLVCIYKIFAYRNSRRKKFVKKRYY